MDVEDSLVKYFVVIHYDAKLKSCLVSVVSAACKVDRSF